MLRIVLRSSPRRLVSPNPIALTWRRPLSSSRALRSPLKDALKDAPPAPGARLPFYRRRPILTACVAVPFVLSGSLAVVLLGLLTYDMSTYSDRHAANVPVDPLALQPERGGKKNLKIATVLVDDSDEKCAASTKKQRLVIVGGGWGAVGVLKKLDPDAWHVTVVSPENYFLFHPLLPSATVGTVEVRSLVEPLRKIIARVSGHFLQARAVDVDMSERLLEVESAGGTENFYLPYDRLIIACGSINSTHGVPGLENCFQLKTVQDAQAIRRRVMDNLEKAALPSTEQTERERLLNFVICGGGPTGVEFASELFDMVHEDVLQYMPKLLGAQVRVHIIQSRDHILNTYSANISDYAEKRFKRNEIDTILNARVKEVAADKVVYTTKDENGKTIEHVVPSGFTLWSTGIAMNPFTQKVASLLPNQVAQLALLFFDYLEFLTSCELQYHKHSLEVDSHLRVIGAPLGTVYALGDCATIETRLVDHLLEMVDRCDQNHDGVIEEKEFEMMMKIVDRKFPTAQVHVEKIRDVFEKYADKQTHVIGLNELAEMFIEISRRMTALPATAQVANQQGLYLGKKLSKLATTGHEVAMQNGIYDDPDDMLYSPFKYHHLGSLAYIGSAAVLDLGGGWNFAGGLMAMYAWRSIYFSEQVSFRSRMLLMFDWIKRGVWGRDLSRF